MKGWIIDNNNKIVETEKFDEEKEDFAKVKLSKSIIEYEDILAYQGKVDIKNIYLGRSGTGIITEIGENPFGLIRGKRVYIDPTLACQNCYNCSIGKENMCQSISVAGKNHDGFMRDFGSFPIKKLVSLPDSITDDQALFIKHISLAESIIDSLNVQKGQYVAVLGGNVFCNVLCQLLIYYSAVPIMLTEHDEEIESAKNSGIYYVFGKDVNWQKEIANITSGRMTEKVAYIFDSGISPVKAFEIASYGANLAFSGSFSNDNKIQFALAGAKQLKIDCINNGCDPLISINLMLNNAINFNYLPIEKEKAVNLVSVFEKASSTIKTQGFKEVIIDL